MELFTKEHEEMLLNEINSLENQIDRLKAKLLKYEDPDEFRMEVYGYIETAMQDVMYYTGLTATELQQAIKDHYGWS